MTHLIQIERSAGYDLAELATGNLGQKRAAAELSALFREMNGSDDRQEHLTKRFFSDNKIHTDTWIAIQKLGYNVWRLKPGYDPSGWADYRVIYWFDAAKFPIHVLAVVHREFGYDPNGEIAARVRADCDRLIEARKGP